MAQQQTVVLIDDLDGGTAEQTVTFSVDGQQYEIDLSRRNIQRLHDILAPFMTNARRARSERGTSPRTRHLHTTDQATAPPASSTSASGVTTSEDVGTETAPQPAVPPALFSNPDDHVPPLAATAPKPHTAGLFSATG